MEVMSSSAKGTPFRMALILGLIAAAIAESTGLTHPATAFFGTTTIVLLLALLSKSDS